MFGGKSEDAMRRVSVMLIVGALLFTASSFAQTQMELNQQADEAYKKSDALLNGAYEKLQAALDDEGKKKLATAQKAWIAFRDAEAESQADEYRGGSIQPMIRLDCERHLTEQRTTELEARLARIEHP